MNESPATTPAGDEPEWDLPDRLRKSLRHAGLGTDEMAAHLHVGRSSVSNWIAGRNRPNAPTLLVWAVRCGVSPEWLAGAASDAEESASDTGEPVSAVQNGDGTGVRCPGTSSPDPEPRVAAPAAAQSGAAEAPA